MVVLCDGGGGVMVPDLGEPREVLLEVRKVGLVAPVPRLEVFRQRLERKDNERKDIERKDIERT